MGMLGDIFGKIFGTKTEDQGDVSADAHKTVSEGSASKEGATKEGATKEGATAKPLVDVDKVISGLAANQTEKLNWKTSIVDLLKVLGLESSLEARKNLAHELSYTGNVQDSATMNIWLHKEVLKRMAANGGKIPEELL